MRYIVLSPVGNRKGYIIGSFLEAVRKFDPPPEEIVLCVSVDAPYDLKTFGDAVIRFNPEISVGDGWLERIASAREILRNYFIYGPYDLALWIDTDIICPPETPKTLYEVMEKEKCLIVVNKVEGRNMDGRLLCGSGVMLTDKIACTASKFWIGRIMDMEGVEKHLSEDFVFFAIFDQGRSFLKRWTGRTGRVCNEYVKVNHRWKGKK